MGMTDEVRQALSFATCVVGRLGSYFVSLKISNAVRKGAMSPSWTLGCLVSPPSVKNRDTHKLKKSLPASGPERKRFVVAFNHSQPIAPE